MEKFINLIILILIIFVIILSFIGIFYIFSEKNYNKNRLESFNKCKYDLYKLDRSFSDQNIIFEQCMLSNSYPKNISLNCINENCYGKNDTKVDTLLNDNIFKLVFLSGLIGMDVISRNIGYGDAIKSKSEVEKIYSNY